MAGDEDGRRARRVSSGPAERSGDGPDGATEADRSAAARRRRAEVFGDVLPEDTSDDRADAWGDRPSSTDDWLRGQVPPHHG